VVVCNLRYFLEPARVPVRLRKPESGTPSPERHAEGQPLPPAETALSDRGR
jgi:hypothetical protein